MRVLLLTLAVATVGAIHSPGARQPLVAHYLTKKYINPAKSVASKIKKSLDVDHAMDHSGVLRGGGESSSSCSKFNILAGAYTACGLAATAAWSTIVYTTIRSNQPQGAMMPSFEHGLCARIGAWACIPLIGSAFYTLASTASNANSWDDLSTPTCRRQNLALSVAGVGSALWTGFAPILTKIPGTDPLLSHQAYKGAMRAGLIGCYGSAAALSAAVWARTLPEEVRNNPLTWPGHIADGVCKSLVSLAPASRDDPVNVKYALLTTSFLIFTGLQLGSHPLSAIPSWTGRRLARAFPAWTLLGATSAYCLKEATENGSLLESANCRALSNGIKGFGTMYLGSKFGAVFLDPSFPGSYHAVVQVPSWATAAILMVGLTLRSDKKEAKYYIK